MEYNTKKKSNEKRLEDIEAKLKEIETPKTNSNNKIEFSTKEIENKLRENSEKKKIVLKFTQAQKLLTKKRRELLKTLSEQEFDSITELAEEIERDKKNVSQDIKKLYQHGIIDLKDQGRSKKPVFKFEKIEIEDLEYKGNKVR